MKKTFILVGSNSRLASEFAKFLRESLHYVIGISNGPSRNLDLHECYTPRDFQRVISGLQGETSVIVVYFAWQSPIRSKLGDVTYLAKQSLNDLQSYARCLEDQGVDRFVFISSAGAVYGDSSSVHSELSVTQPLTQYGIEKVQAESMLLDVFAPNKLLICRLSNPYGFLQLPENGIGFVDHALRGARDSGFITVFGSTEIERDYIHISNVNESILRLIDENAFGIFNIAFGKSFTVGEIARHVQSSFTSCEIRYLETTDSSIKACRLDNSKMASLYPEPLINVKDWISEHAEE